MTSLLTPSAGASDPDEADPAVARWPWWFGPAAFVAALAAAVPLGALAVGTVRAVGGAGHRSDHVVALLAAGLVVLSLLVVAAIPAQHPDAPLVAGVVGAPALAGCILVPARLQRSST